MHDTVTFGNDWISVHTKKVNDMFQTNTYHNETQNSLEVCAFMVGISCAHCLAVHYRPLIVYGYSHWNVKSIVFTGARLRANTLPIIQEDGKSEASWDLNSFTAFCLPKPKVQFIKTFRTNYVVKFSNYSGIQLVLLCHAPNTHFEYDGLLLILSSAALLVY